MILAGIMNVPVRAGSYRDSNYEEAVRLIRAAAGQGARLACTYEQFLDGYGFDGNKIPSIDDPNVERCEVIGDSVYVKGLAELAGELEITIVAGVATQEGSGTYNSALVFGSDGHLLGHYRKTHNAGHYATWFAPLSQDRKKASCPSFDVGTGKVGIKICNDRHFSETTAYLIENGCELLLCPSFGKYDPSRLLDDSADYGIWTVFVHPEGCQFIHNGKVVREQKPIEDRGSYALHEVEFIKPIRR